MTPYAVATQSHLLPFTIEAFRWSTGREWLYNWHHAVICSALERVYSGEITRLIINLPPAYSKTQIATINFPALGFARNPAARFILVGYSQQRSYESSRMIRDTLQLTEFRRNWPVTLREDKNAVGAWGTSRGGALLAASAGGQITGFHAGVLGAKTFSGAILFDDPLKPDDASSAVKRAIVNDRFINTFRSRLAQESVPIVVIMQRIHDDDLSGFLLRGGSPSDKWHHLVLPAIVDGPLVYPSDYSHGMPIDIHRPCGALWPTKQALKTLKALSKSDYVWAAQYQQFPQKLGGSVFRSDWWTYYQSYDPYLAHIVLSSGEQIKLKRKVIYADTAQKTGEQNDYSVFQCWALGNDEKIYLLDQVRGKWTAPELRAKFTAFCQRHEYEAGKVALGLFARRVEDKSSGTGLIQELGAMHGTIGRVTGIPRDRDKVSRAHGVTLPMADHRVCLPLGAIWLEDYLREFEAFSADMSHKHDDQVDCTMDAIEELLIKKPLDYEAMVRGRK